MKKIQILWLSTLFMMSCSGGNEKKAASVTKTTEEIISTEIPKIVKISIEGDDMMRYNLDKIEVNAGQTVELTLTHTGQMSALRPLRVDEHHEDADAVCVVHHRRAVQLLERADDRLRRLLECEGVAARNRRAAPRRRGSGRLLW